MTKFSLEIFLNKESTKLSLQLVWPQEMATLKINLPRDQEGYDRFEYTDEKLLARRIYFCGEPSSIFIF